MDMRRGFVRLLYLVAGHAFLTTGMIGIFVPLLPTTPFLILACFCYERGSPRFHRLILENRLVGPYVRTWRERGAIPKRAKALAVLMIGGGIGWSIAVVPIVSVRVMLLFIAVLACGYILTRPSA